VPSVLACSDCYARSATGTYALLGGLTVLSLIVLVGALSLGKRQRVRRAAAIAVTGLLALLMTAGLALPAMPVSGWQPQPHGPKYELVCGSAIHASLQGWTGPAGDALEARDRAYCSRWGNFNVHLGEGLLVAAACLSLAFFMIVRSWGGRVTSAAAAVVT
jgi:hypothetical protein